ncbi:PREDICTED: leucine-rich repeat and immunoglobulin-like domain-containing nogo receptor-interacting protein 3 [Branchiostoma belcheri]|uniref:Leucine-rich repeat and immunoglobulin-like domain-containing nogo receptor-interacting protein 3 n=1 Tax=Branchiostoma belcheri TaxID=7741 RepID=A0A6P5AB57_BRABE|nr:PREDICTED: leucine-rich repeat and immunoglobulin-like domain-containing nogo receptor-interacting protein 3 [Branchiostoma belcheri]
MGAVGSLQAFLVVVTISIVVWGEALPRDCICPKRSTFSSLEVKCTDRGLTALPDNIPSQTYLLYLYNNRLQQVAYFPPLPRLYTLDLSDNLIETVSWSSLCNLPNMRYLILKSNRITSVRLAACITRLTQLSMVDLSCNRIATVAEGDLGVPHIQATVSLHHNPFHCDCELRWLIAKLKCLQNHPGRGLASDQCDATFLPSNLGGHRCSSPAKFRERPLASVSIPSSKCESPVRPSTTSSPIKPNGGDTGTIKSTRSYGLIRSIPTLAGSTQQMANTTFEEDDAVTEVVSETLTIRSGNITDKEVVSVSNVMWKRDESLIETVIGVVLAISLGCLMLKLVKNRYRI